MLTGRAVWAHEAVKGRAYWYPDADCHRQQRGAGYYFQFYAGYGGGGRETLMHELAKLLIVKRKRVAARTPEGLVYIILSNVVSEEALDHRRPDVSGIVTECYPRLIPAGGALHVEVHVTNPVDETKKQEMDIRGEPVLEIDLPRDLEPFLNKPVSGQDAVTQLERKAYLAHCRSRGPLDRFPRL